MANEVEQYANNCIATVAAGGYTSGSGILNVDSTAAPWPQVGNFRLIITDVSRTTVKVILKVTAKNSATQWAVTAEGTDASASAGDLALGTVVTAGVANSLGRKLLQTKTAAGDSTLDFASWYNSAYDVFEIEIAYLIPGTDAQTLQIRCSVDGGLNYDSGANYSYNLLAFRPAGSGGNGNSGQTKIDLIIAQKTTSGWSLSGLIRLVNPASATLFKQFEVINVSGIDGTGRICIMGQGVYEVATAVNGIRFLFASGTLASGVIRIYGVNKI